MTHKSAVDSSKQVKLSGIADIRTGLITTRKKKSGNDGRTFVYRLLNLKCIDAFGFINTETVENFESSEKLKSDFFTRAGDILIRLSFPYTIVFIDKKEHYGLLVPSHFAIVRANNPASAKYVFWALRRAKSRAALMQKSASTVALPVVTKIQIEELVIPIFSEEKQKLIGNIFIASEREHELMLRLAEEKTKLYSALLEQFENKYIGEKR